MGMTSNGRRLPRSAGSPDPVARGALDDQRAVAADVGRRLAGGADDLVARHDAQELVERDAGLEAGERGAQAVVDAVAEREVPLGGAIGIEAVGLREGP